MTIDHRPYFVLVVTPYIHTAGTPHPIATILLSNQTYIHTYLTLHPPNSSTRLRARELHEQVPVQATSPTTYTAAVTNTALEYLFSWNDHCASTSTKPFHRHATRRRVEATIAHLRKPDLGSRQLPVSRRCVVVVDHIHDRFSQIPPPDLTLIMSRSSPRVLSPQNTGASTPSQYSATTNNTWATQADSSSGTSYPVSTVSDESAGGRIWKSRQPVYSSHSSSASKMVKIKSPPNYGTLPAARSALSHGKLHKRGSSASSAQSPQAGHVPIAELQYPSPILFGDFYTPPSPSSVSKTKTKIKPLLRKLTPQEKNSLDLSRTAAENEGLGIYTLSDLGSGSGDAASTAAARRAYHNRTTSGTSEYSNTTTSSHHRPGAPYVHPMRQTPRPYTPPLAHSYQNSVLDSEYSAEGTILTIDEEQNLRQIVRDASYRGAGASAPTPIPKQPPLRIQTGSSVHLAGSSQSNLAGTPSSIRPRANTMSPVDTMSPISRSSLEGAFRLRSRVETDPASREASIRAARQAFSEKEAAKAQKAEKEELRVLQRENRKREKREDSHRRKEEGTDRTRAKSRSLNEKQAAVPALVYSDMPPASNLENAASSVGDQPRARRRTRNPSVTNTAKSRWVLFLTWLRTRIFKLGKKVSSTS